MAEEEKKERQLELAGRVHRRWISPLKDFLMWLLVWVPLVFAAVWEILLLLAKMRRGREDEFGLLALLSWLAVPLLVAGGGTLLALGVNALVRSLSSARRERAQLVLGYLENAVRLNFPLDRFLEAAQESERGIRQVRLRELREALRRGWPVGTALMSAVPEVPVRTAWTLVAAERIGTLQRAMSRLMRREERVMTAEPQTTPFYRFYLPMMILGGGGVLLFLAFIIMPKFREIFKDFHTTMPALTVGVFGVVSAVAENGVFDVIVPWVPLLVLLLLMARGLQQALQRLRGVNRRPFFMGMGIRWVGWYLPVIRRLLRARAYAEVFEFLSDGMRSEVPLAEAVGAAADLGVPRSIRRRLSRWQEGMMSGRTPAEAGRRAGLPRMVVGFLATGEASASSMEMFAFLGQFYRARFSRLAVVIRAAAEPAAVLLLGILVGVVVYSVFTPLVALINAVIHSSERGFL